VKIDIPTRNLPAMGRMKRTSRRGSAGHLGHPGGRCAAHRPLVALAVAEKVIDVLRRKLRFWYRVRDLVRWPVPGPFTKQDWHGTEHLPTTGGFLVVANHITHLAPLTCGHFLLYTSGRQPHPGGKASRLFAIPVLGRALRDSGRFPVHQESTPTEGAFHEAVSAVGRGECVTFYPETGITRDPDLWPMVAKTGVARVALATGAPVIPIAQWGAQEILAPYTKKARLFPRKTIHVLAGPPVDLSAFQGQAPTTAVLREATEKIMDELVHQLEELRNEKAPAERSSLWTVR
jgi:1-acyl-sn-glycerol-3-phosphate acyltransferase